MKVLLVDPVADLLPSLQNALLSVNGLELYCAPDGATAVQHSMLLGGVDLLITEITAPDVDGLSLSAELRRSLPRLKTVFLTRKIPGAHAATPRGSVVLGIPVDPEKVLSAIHSPAPTRQIIDVPFVVQPARDEFSSKLGQENQGEGTPPSSHERGIDDQNQIVLASDLIDPLPPKGAEAPAILKSRFEIIRHSIDPSESSFSSESNELANEEWPQFEIVDPADSLEPLDTIAPLHPGARLGAYHILREDSPHLLGQSFAAVHTTLGRTVHLIVLDAAFETNIETKSVFIADAAAKASAHHPGLLAVYEAGEIEGRTFYALERLEAETIANLLERRATLSSNVLREVAKTVSEVMIYFEENRMTRESLRAENILVTIDGIPRLRNIATGGLQGALESFDELSAMSKWLMALLSEQTPSTLRVVCDRISRSHPDAILDFKTFLGAIRQASPGRQSQNRPGSHLHPHTPKQSSIAKGLLAAACALIIAAFAFHNLSTQTQQVPRQVEIPAGQYIVGSGKRVALDAFTIDVTEVSNRQYFEFIAWLRSHPNDASRFDHPEQTPQHSHIPPGWNEQFPEKSGPRKSPEDSRWELPVTQITWWDAFAFASWAGRSLPTEEQWEAAGRGTRGFLFPWGDEPEPERTNVAKPESKRTAEDSNIPRPVMALMDKSTMGVSALAGNVSEWTSTNRDGKYAVKGSHFNGPLVPLDYSPVFSPDTRMPHLGFRTTSASPPSSHP